MFHEHLIQVLSLGRSEKKLYKLLIQWPFVFIIIRVFNLQIISVAADFVTELSMRIAMPARQLVGPFQFLDVVAELNIYDNFVQSKRGVK